MHTPLIRRVVIRNYKSIATCDVALKGLMFLVGSNGAGKSNFLDAFRFVADSLRNSLDHALRERGTIKEVRRKSGGHPNHFSLKFEFVLPTGRSGFYEFKIGAGPSGGYKVQYEECRVYPENVMDPEDFFIVSGGVVSDASFELRPVTLPDRLYLVAASGLSAFRPVFDALSRIEVYNLDPRAIASMQRPDPGDILRRDGSNAASVLQKLQPNVRQAISESLARIVPGVSGAEPKQLGSQETMEFRQSVHGQQHSWRFLASSMSDGTLRAFGVLVAVFQSLPDQGRQVPPVIGLEEPEMALHPAAAHVLLSVLRKGSESCQILVTSHSPDLLDNQDIDADSILAIENLDGATRIGRIDAAGRRMLKEKLFTPGELLRQNQIKPESAESEPQYQNQLFTSSEL